MGKVKIDAESLGNLVWLAVHKGLSSHAYFADQAIALAKRHWKDVEPYHQRRIICDVQVAVELDSATTGEAVRDNEGRPAPRRKLDDREKWERFAKELEPPKAAYTVKYHCHKCKAKGLKLWRPVHGGTQDGYGLQCASCLAPDVKVGDDGRWQEPGEFGMRTDQVKGWLPAVPVDDTFWGYSSAPSADVRWWRELPTYAEVREQRV